MSVECCKNERREISFGLSQTTALEGQKGHSRHEQDTTERADSKAN
jgi:hypothetical protein